MFKPLFAVALIGGMCLTVTAEESDHDPARGVARISLINGDVSVQRGDSGDIIAAAVNSPLVVQDRVLTGPASRAEVQFDWSNMIRLSREAEIRLTELQYKRYMVQVAKGTTTFRVLRDQDAEVEVSTPSVSVRPVKKGEYRITVLEDGTSEITIRSGEAEVYTPRGSERLKSGRTMLARGTQADPEYQTVSELREDDWDRWNEQRDKDLSRSRSYSYVSRDIYGADDLDDHGRWVQVNNYGWVWSPRVAVGWAPYRHGRWSWMDYYGWSWVSHDPWGWAPYHYGRWFYNAPIGWCWWPGSIGARHYWSPGLVAFFGGGGVNVGFGFGRIGWVPLAPYERYRPWYGRNYYNGYRNGYGNNVHIVNNVNITNVYRNSRIDHAVTSVDHDGFRRGRPGTSLRVQDGEFSRVSTFEGRVPVTPARESLRLVDRDAVVRASGTREDSRFFSRRQPAAVERVPFEDQRRGMETVTRRTFGAEDSERGERGPSSAAAGTPSINPGTRAETRASGTESDSGRGWRRLGETPDRSASGVGRTGATERSLDRSPGNASEGWRRFGSPRIESQAPGAGNGAGRDNSARDGRAGQFGQPSVETGADRNGIDRSSAGRGSVSTNGRGTDWRGFNNSGRSEAAATSGDAPVSIGRGEESRFSNDNWRRGEASSRTDGARSEQPRGERQDTRNNDFSRGSGGNSVRISPPIVRERPSFNSGGRGAGGRSFDSSGGGGRSTPPSAASGGGRGAAGSGGTGGGGRGSGPSGGGASRGGSGGGRGR